VEKKEQWTWK